jgi:hypothetical protein
MEKMALLQTHIKFSGSLGSGWPGGGCDGILLEGDLVLSINGKPVTKPHDAWQKMLMRTRELGKSGWNWDTKFMTGD